MIVSVGALALPDARRLAGHATDAGVDGVLLMPPGVYREGITEDATFRYFDAVIERVARPGLRLYLYHFPGISGVPVTPQVIRRLDERHPGIIAGVKDFGRRRRVSPPSWCGASRICRSSPAARRICPT